MWDFVSQFWDQGVDIATLIIALIAALGAIGFFRKEQFVRGEKLIVEQERDELRRQLAALEVRFEHVDPEFFLKKSAGLYAKGAFDKVEETALDYTNRHSEAFGRAAEYLAEQRVIDSDEHGLGAAEEAARFAAIGRAAFPDSKRLEELADLAERRKQGIERGEPIEALLVEGLSGFELNELAVRMRKAGKFILAEIAAHRSIPLTAQSFGQASSQFATALSVHATLLGDLGDRSAAVTQHEHALEIAKTVFGETDYEMAVHYNNLGLAKLQLGEPCEAENLIRTALRIDSETIGKEHPEYVVHSNNLALALEKQKRFVEAEEIFRRLMKIDPALTDENQPSFAVHLNNLASVVVAQGRLAEGEELYREALDIGLRTIGEDHPQYGVRLGNLGHVLGQQGKIDEARDTLVLAVKILNTGLSSDHPDVLKAQRHLAALPPATD